MKSRLERRLLVGTVLVVLCSPLCSALQNARASSELTATHYTVRLLVQPEQRHFEAQVNLRFRNRAGESTDQVPLMLYRLLSVKSAMDTSGHELSFSQQVVNMADEELWQVNQVHVKLSEPLAPGKETEIVLQYRGTLAGYAEVMRYVQDRIDEDYTLFRAETMPYPVLGVASQEAWRRLYDSPFTYDVRAVVPTGYSVACGGTKTTETRLDQGSEFSCSTSEPQSQLNLAIAKFKMLQDEDNHLRVYALRDDAEAGAAVLRELKRALHFFASYFEVHEGERDLTIIELPENWGSYTGNGFIFQTAVAFKNPTQVVELYHEVAHRWNARTTPQLQRTRWFDEAFASYFEALALRALSGEKAYINDLERAKKSFVRAAKKNPEIAKVPIAGYGDHDMGQYSYTKGAWSLYVLHRSIGEQAFRRSMAEFLKQYESKPAGFDDFRRVVEHVSGRNLQRYFDEWISGAESSHLLIDDQPITTIVARYRK